jgi:hypothetical protein
VDLFRCRCQPGGVGAEHGPDEVEVEVARHLLEPGDDTLVGRLGDQDHELGGVVAGKQPQRLLGGETTDARAEVAATHPEAVPHADALCVEQRHQVLRAGARGGYE